MTTIAQSAQRLSVEVLNLQSDLPDSPEFDPHTELIRQIAQDLRRLAQRLAATEDYLRRASA